jgi:hypothetical protein
MRLASWSICLLLACLYGCCHSGEENNSEPIAVISGHYVLSGNVAKAGEHSLYAGDTVGKVLSRVGAQPGKPITLVLIRRAPEGKTRQLIQLDADGKLMDETQNYVLRDGDELAFPGASSNVGPNTNIPTH